MRRRRLRCEADHTATHFFVGAATELAAAPGCMLRARPIGGEQSVGFCPDPSDRSGKLGMVDIAPMMPVKTPVGEREWAVICGMAGIRA